MTHRNALTSLHSELPDKKTSSSPRSDISPRNATIIRRLHVLVLLASVGLIALITWDSCHNISFVANETYLRVQFWICAFFITDIIVEYFLYPHKWRYLASHIFFLIVSIPYVNIIAWCDLQLSPVLQYVIRFVPLIRAGYVLSLVLRVFFSNKISGLLASYIGLLVATVYFASLIFFIEEHGVNPGVTDYWSALWWAFMDVTTVGCNINCMTPIGKTLGAILAAEGLILFPIFTVYVTNALSLRNARATR